ncbi:hypothetical protein [Marasmitruncus massiliensis]|uniref:hypothetical protein n=1 Tax=Marasmitruncus massiliensis TaxID=1944642 RepID=UPI000C7A2F58|nr:hypothetical protein [Marasmitruncus massiliensis]
MKKKWLTVVLTVLLIFSGCSSVEDAKTAVLSWMGKEQTVRQETALAEGQYQISGKIKEIRGNEMTLELGELEGSGRQNFDREKAEESGGQNRSSGRQSAGEPASPFSAEQGTPPSDTQGGDLPEIQGDALSETQDGTRSGSGKGDSAARRSGASGSGRQSFTATFQKSGETKICLIPVKTPVYAAGNTGTKLSFSQLEVGAVITATLQKSDSGDDYFISIQVVG